MQNMHWCVVRSGARGRSTDVGTVGPGARRTLDCNISAPMDNRLSASNHDLGYSVQELTRIGFDPNVMSCSRSSFVSTSILYIRMPRTL